MEDRSVGTSSRDAELIDIEQRHRRLGWWTLLLFLCLGSLLEVLHGFKAGFYLDVSNETRRHLWTLSHAHGTLIALVHLAFSSSVAVAHQGVLSLLRRASASLVAASILLPGGFFLGGAVVYGGDPGLGIVLVPFGALALAVAVACTAIAQHR